MSGWKLKSDRIGFAVRIVAAMAVATASINGEALAQTTLDAGKTPAQIFQSDCAPCHKSPQGLFKGALGLSTFLRQHYTASKENAEALANYLAAADKGGAPAASRKRDAKPAAAKKEEGSETPSETSSETKPARKPAAKKPEPKSDAKPAAAKPEDKPAESKPAESKPAEAKPAEAKPAEEKPAASAPAESKPAETAKPAE